MKMLRYLGLMVFVVFITAFASGCGGGGGGSAMDDDDGAVMMCTEGQVGTYPDCMDPGPTDEDRIASAKDTLTGIIADAGTREGATRTAVAAVEGHADATEVQKARAGSLGDAARDALTDIGVASAAANAATTGAQAERAVADANAALSDLRTAQSSVASIQSAVNAVADLHRQQATDEKLATNGSSLIKHVRDNKLVYDAVLLAGIGTGSISVGPTDNDNQAEYPYYEDRTADKKVSGVRQVTAKTLPSSSTTPTLTGPSALRYGFDLKNETDFVNAYTNIERADRVSKIPSIEDDKDTNIDERYDHVADTDYLLAGIWLDDGELKAFAHGSQPIVNSHNFCGVGEVAAASTDTTGRACDQTQGLATISTFVDTDKDVKATYSGDANGAYLAGGAMSYFEADVTLNAEFVNENDVGRGSIEGEVTNIVAGGKSIKGSIDLISHTLGDKITAKFGVNPAASVLAGENYTGNWTGQFFRMRADWDTSNSERDTTQIPPVTTTTTYTAEAPGSVAGTFYVIKQTAPAGDAAFIGAFGAHRPR